MSAHRRSVRFNPSVGAAKTVESALHFHKNLEGYLQSPLVALESVATDLGVRAVYLKDETNRFGLPGCDILGVSWGVFKAVTKRLDLSVHDGFSGLKDQLVGRSVSVSLFAAARGSDAAAVARVGTLLAVPVHLYVPLDFRPEVEALIFPQVEAINKVVGGYGVALLEARKAAEQAQGICVNDIEDIAHGYSTMLHELDNQLAGQQVSLIVSPVGDGSLAQAAIGHYKVNGSQTAFVGVEPDTAGTLYKSLARGEYTPEMVGSSVMNEISPGILSSSSWPHLKSGTDATLTVSDHEAHSTSLELQRLDVPAGPSGAASLAALRRLSESDRARLGLDSTSIVVLLCTHGTTNSYPPPRDVSLDDVVSLTQAMIQIDSSNPSFGVTPGVGEGVIADYVAAWLQHRDIECHWIEPTIGRPSVVGVVRGTGGGKSLMFNGHTDTVTCGGYDGDPLSGVIKDNNIYGRGAADMKSGLAAEMVALANAKGLGLRGDVILAAVADEEARSIGTEQVLAAGWWADAAITAEPTEMNIIHTHKGFAIFEVDILGVAAHGSRPELGIDAICKAGYFLVELDRYAQTLLASCSPGSMPATGPPNVHTGVIRGGEEEASFPAKCTVVIERRTNAGETLDQVRDELQVILQRLASTVASFKYELRSMFHRSPYFIDAKHPFVDLVIEKGTQAMGRVPSITGERYWTDTALMAEKGIAGVIWGPNGFGLHAKTEWVEIESLRRLTEAFKTIVTDYCR